MKDEKTQPLSRSYLLRFWQVTDQEDSPWRFMLLDPHTNERFGFVSLAQMTAFLADQTDLTTHPSNLDG